LESGRPFKSPPLASIIRTLDAARAFRPQAATFYGYRGTMRFLVVDDSSTMRRIITNTLNKIGQHDVIEASNGREGLEKLATTDVDLIITDWNMPEMNGIDFIRALRASASLKETPVLMVTTNAAKDDIVEALRAGVNSYIVKPFSPDTFKEKIEAVRVR
jgi:two-component system chemotaxis response regulator CheY